ncbi:adenylate/guanylate cyclase domain-containing protein [Candidatus Nitrosocosmicus hydrocola]|uniref:adenylate/guanylate cyclase domain-containing protein n=1 Tax=Candidatus Nitrosocosmicus hydrocola TaxID=1826872 RepID=UPI000A8CFB75|nr:adenylate/guanylate cyclase domain-containing protein [Candidatus Nitrosocosmicus hydrocola]
MNKGIDVDKHVLVKYFDSKVFDILKDPEQRTLKNKYLSVVFWDISGFANLCNKLIDEPFAITELLKLYFQEANDIIHRYHGIIDKFIGDGVMAYFGYSSDEKQEIASHTINAALDLREKFEDIKLYWLTKFVDKSISLENVYLKCGIHVGYVLFGLLETKFRNQITLVGTNVNFASRLEGIAEKNQIIVSKEMIDLVKNSYYFDTITHDIHAYGKTEVFNIKGKRE